MERIEARIKELEQEIAAIAAEGTYYRYAWICDVAPGNSDRKYNRVQSTIPQFGGKKTRHIKKGEKVSDFSAACRRGHGITTREKEIATLRARLEA